MPAKATLTDLSVRALKAPARGQYTVWDKISPVGVRVSQGGSKTFILMIARGQRRTIGRVGIITLAEARTEAKRILAERTLGIGHKATNVTFDDALPQFVEEKYRSKSPRSKHEANRLLRTHFLSALRTKKLSDITDQDVSKELGKLTHVPSEQLHAFRALRAMLRWCTRPPRRYLRYSPLEGYEAPGEDTKRSRALTDQELAKVWNACDGFFGDLIRLLILWGTRNGETGRLHRTWVEDSVLTIPGAFTKNGRAHASRSYRWRRQSSPNSQTSVSTSSQASGT
jgi:Arm DNA-binding domain